MSEDFQRPQVPSNTESHDSGVPESAVDQSHHEAANQPDQQVQPYPQAHINTGEYRRTDVPTTANPQDMNENNENTGPIAPTTPPARRRPSVGQPRPSGALGAEAWSAPTPTGSYPAGSYGTGAYRNDNPWSPP